MPGSVRMGLADGLRALETLARGAPLTLAEFARLTRLPEDRAKGLMTTFVQSGCAQRAPHAPLYRATPLGLRLAALPALLDDADGCARGASASALLH